MKKKILLLSTVFAGIFGLTASAQTAKMGPVLPNGKDLSNVRATRPVNTMDKASVGRWMFYDEAYAAALQTTPDYNFVNFIFPDSTIMTNPSSPFNTWTHKVGQVYELTSDFWATNGSTIKDSLDFTQAINIDSLYLLGFYARVDNTSNDTLKIRFHAPSATNLNSLGYFGSTLSANYGVDTVFVVSYLYNYQTNTLPGANQTKTIILNDAYYADSTSNGLHENKYATPGWSIPGGTGLFGSNLFGFGMEFVPGYTYTPNVDVIGRDKNGYRPLSCELGGNPDGTTGTYPVLLNQGDVTASYLLTSGERYNQTGNGWNGEMVPHFAFVQAYSWEYNLIVPYISQTNTNSISEKESGVSLRVYPNPAVENVTINFDSKNATKATVSLTDISGKSIRTIQNQNIDNGTNYINMNVSDISNGIYFVRITSPYFNVTRRLIVKH